MNVQMAEETPWLRNQREINDHAFPEGFLEHQMNRVMGEINKLFHEMEGTQPI